MHAPGDVPTKSSDSPYIEKLKGLSKAETKTAEKAGAIALPSAKDLGYEWDTFLLVFPGETAAKEKLEEFCDRAIYSITLM